VRNYVKLLSQTRLHWNAIRKTNKRSRQVTRF